MKLKLSIFTLSAAALWLASIGFIIVGLALSSAQNVAIQQAQNNVQKSREKLAIAQIAEKDETKQLARRRLEQAQRSLDTFSCHAAAESAMIFQIGQLANALQLNKFTSRYPDSAVEKTLEKSERIVEGWLAVDFVADYLKTAAFINGLERHEPLLFVESIHLRRSEENPEEASVRLMLSYLIRKPENSRAVARANAAD